MRWMPTLAQAVEDLGVEATKVTLAVTPADLSVVDGITYVTPEGWRELLQISPWHHEITQGLNPWLDHP